MSDPNVLVTFSPTPSMREAISDVLGTLGVVRYLVEAEPDARPDALASADVVMSWIMARELRGPEEGAQLGSARLVQLLSAGVDHFPLDWIPDEVPVASNAGAYASPMAEHVLAMALALAKHLPQRHADLKAGIFDAQTLNRAIAGSVVCIVGFGGIGRASAQLFRALGARIWAVTRSGAPEERVEKVGTLDDLGDLLAGADVVVLSLPLTRRTRGLFGAPELERMKADGILVNVARGPIIDEDALYEHLAARPSFQVAIDTWWDEARDGGRFSPRRPFFELANVLGSPHNSGMTDTALADATREAAANVARALRGEPILHRVDRSEYLE